MTDLAAAETRLARVAEIGGAYASSVMDVYACEPIGQFYRDIEAKTGRSQHPHHYEVCGILDGALHGPFYYDKDGADEAKGYALRNGLNCVRVTREIVVGKS